MTESQISQMESGDKPLPAELLQMIAEHTGLRPEEVFSDAVNNDRNTQPFDDAMAFLDQVRRMGITGVHVDRDAAMMHLVAFAKRMYAGTISITGSTLSGLRQKSTDHELIKVFQSFAAEEVRPRVKIQVIMTSPKYSESRERLERKPRGFIRNEIYAGLDFCLNVLRVNHNNIRLIDASPCLFSMFLDNGSEAQGMVNPYPLRRQAFTSFAITFRRLKNMPLVHSLYEQAFQANFKDPWDDKDITEPLLGVLKELQASKDTEWLRYSEVMGDHIRTCEKQDEEERKKKETKKSELARPASQDADPEIEPARIQDPADKEGV